MALSGRFPGRVRPGVGPPRAQPSCIAPIAVEFGGRELVAEEMQELGEPDNPASAELEPVAAATAAAATGRRSCTAAAATGRRSAQDVVDATFHVILEWLCVRVRGVEALAQGELRVEERLPKLLQM